MFADEYALTCSISVASRSDYDMYTCHASNIEGNLTLDVELQAPGPPDSPQSCSVASLSAHEVVVSCIPGFDGGLPLDFYVEKQTSTTEPSEVRPPSSTA